MCETRRMSDSAAAATAAGAEATQVEGTAGATESAVAVHDSMESSVGSSGVAAAPEGAASDKGLLLLHTVHVVSVR